MFSGAFTDTAGAEYTGISRADYQTIGLQLLVCSTQAGQLPLTASEIGLMLRTGYSSTSLMQELAKRHFADTLDETKATALSKAGASVELIAALKSGTYSLSPEKTAAVQ